jgi:hypothetical protein
MKNVHLIPTESYSPLVHSTNKYGGLFLSRHYSPMKEMGDSYQNIYTTNSQEIKEGDWRYNTQTHSLIPPNTSIIGGLSEYDKKIILTTDPDLIKDGVQAIDDEFLEWFVKNPSCEFVEIANDLKYFNVDELRERHLKRLPHLYSESIGYKIIIPQEEPKQLNPEDFGLPQLGTKEFNNLAMEMFGGKPKQETIEEAAEKMYSEEDMIEFAVWLYLEIGSNKGKERTNKELFNKWFEQFKKK